MDDSLSLRLLSGTPAYAHMKREIKDKAKKSVFSSSSSAVNLAPKLVRSGSGAESSPHARSPNSSSLLGGQDEPVKINPGQVSAGSAGSAAAGSSPAHSAPSSAVWRIPRKSEKDARSGALPKQPSPTLSLPGSVVFVPLNGEEPPSALSKRRGPPSSLLNVAMPRFPSRASAASIDAAQNMAASADLQPDESSSDGEDSPLLAAPQNGTSRFAAPSERSRSKAMHSEQFSASSTQNAHSYISSSDIVRLHQPVSLSSKLLDSASSLDSAEPAFVQLNSLQPTNFCPAQDAPLETKPEINPTHLEPMPAPQSASFSDPTPPTGSAPRQEVAIQKRMICVFISYYQHSV